MSTQNSNSESDHNSDNDDDCHNDDEMHDTVEQYSDAESDVMDELIDSNKVGQTDFENVQGRTPALPQVSSDYNVIDKIFSDNYVVDVPSMYLDNVSSLLASNVTDWCRTVPKRSDVKEMFKSCLCPANVKGLQPVKINESVYKILPPRAKVANQKIRGITTFITRSLGPLLPIFENLCKIEGECTGDPTEVKIGDSAYNIKQWRTSMGNSLHLSCYSLAILTQRRKANIRPFLDPTFAHLTRDSNPVSTWLLGNNLDESIASSTKVFDLARKVKRTFQWSRDQKPRGRGGRGSYSSISYRRRNTSFHNRSYFRQQRGKNNKFSKTPHFRRAGLQQQFRNYPRSYNAGRPRSNGHDPGQV